MMAASGYLNPVFEVSVENLQSDSRISQYQVIQNLLADAQLYTELNKKSTGRTIMMHKTTCQCCNGKSETWYCKDCVRNGDFYHSKVKVPERFAEKKLRLRRYLQSFDESERRLANGDHHPSRKALLLEQIEHTRERIGLISNSIASGREMLNKAHEEKYQLSRRILLEKENLPQFRSRLNKIQGNIDIYNDRIKAKTSSLQAHEEETKSLLRQRIAHLTKFIFPLMKICDKSFGDNEEKDSEEENVKMLLAEALQTHYVQGRWIRSTHFTQQENYQLISTILPGSGDYADFNMPYVGIEDNEKKNAQNICAALSLLSQLVEILSVFLHVQLPRKFDFSEFGEFTFQQMNKNKFKSLVTKLNVNIVYLCVSQGVAASALHPTRTVSNLMTLIDGKEADIGRRQCFEFDKHLLDEITTTGCFEDGGEASDSEAGEDWVQVPASETRQSVSPLPMTEGGHYRRFVPDENTQSGIISAAASVMSMFRGFTGTPQK